MIPILKEAVWAPGPVGMCTENLSPHRDLIPGPSIEVLIIMLGFALSTTSICGPGSSVPTDYELDGPGSNSGVGEIFSTYPYRPWGPPSLLYNGYRVFLEDKIRPGREADHSPSSAEVMEEYSYTSTHPLGHTGPVTGLLYLYYFH
jgi:hypothetical protein